MPTKKGTSQAQTPKKAKRIIKIKRKTSSNVKPVTPKKPIDEVPNGQERMNRFFTFVALDGKRYSLTKKQKSFVEHYLEFKANGVDAIIEAGYDVYFKDKKTGESTGAVNYKMAAVMASKELIKVNISSYVTLLLDEYGYTDENATKQHLFLMNQYGDFTAKAKALDMFFKVRGAYAPEKQQHSMDEEITEALSKIASLVGR
jgi:hypothetical protein